MNKIKTLRKICNVKQYELAKQLGIEQSNYANMENGKLITNSIDEIKEKAIKILLPKLNEIILSKDLQLRTLMHIRKEFIK